MISRRTFVAAVAGALPVALVTRKADALSARWIAGESEMLRALAEAVLPSEIGAAGAAKVAADFVRWMDEYKEGAELDHGYGTSALRFMRASPRPRWAAQIERMSTPGARPFVELTLEQRRNVVRDELKSERTDRMPSVPAAPHVALALMAFYYGSPGAADLCYNAQIGRQTCRPLAQQSRKPLPLAGGRS
ncbi:MAG TPA: hypothetical protein VF483_06610 [Gemmatimonadaceae bacterium]